MQGRKTKTYQYSLSGDLIAVYESITKASEAGFHPQGIRSCIDEYRPNKTHRGFIWSDRELSIEECERKNNKHAKYWRIRMEARQHGCKKLHP